MRVIPILQTADADHAQIQLSLSHSYFLYIFFMFIYAAYALYVRTLNLKTSPMTSGCKADVIKEQNVTTIFAQFKSKQFAKTLSDLDYSQVVADFWLKW